MWQLKKDGEILATFPTRRQCIIEAYESGLVVSYRSEETLIDGVTLEKESGDVEL